MQAEAGVGPSHSSTGVPRYVAALTGVHQLTIGLQADILTCGADFGFCIIK